jgi:integrase/recombinase XerD
MVCIHANHAVPEKSFRRLPGVTRAPARTDILGSSVLTTPLPGGFTRPELLDRVAGFYAQRLKKSALPIGWLHSRGLGQPLLWNAFHLGWVDGTLADTLPRSGPLWDALVELGVFTPLGTERLDGCLVVPLSHPDAGLVGLYGWRIGPDHGYTSHRVMLAGSEYGVLNWPALKSEPSVLLTATVLDALAVWRAGVRAVSCLLDGHTLPPGLDDLLQRFHTIQVRLCVGADPVVTAGLVAGLARRGIASRVVTGPDKRGPGHVLVAAGAAALQARLQDDEGLDLPLWRTRFEQYMTARGWTDRTIESYAGELPRFFGFLKAQAVGRVTDLTRETVEAYRMHLFQSPWRAARLLPRSQSASLTAVKAFTRFLLLEHYLLMDPGHGVVGPRVSQGLPRALLSEAQVETLLATSHRATPLEIRNRAVLEVLYSTAMRNQELRRLRIDDVALDRRLVAVRDGKGRKNRLLPLGSEALRWLHRWLKEGRPQLLRGPDQGALFVTQRGGAMSRDLLVWIVSRAGRRAELPIIVTPHLIRHCCATHMLARGAGLRYLQELLGHASPDTTQRYTQVELSDLRAVHRRCHPREQGLTS